MFTRHLRQTEPWLLVLLLVTTQLYASVANAHVPWSTPFARLSQRVRQSAANIRQRLRQRTPAARLRTNRAGLPHREIPDGALISRAVIGDGARRQAREVMRQLDPDSGVRIDVRLVNGTYVEVSQGDFHAHIRTDSPMDGALMHAAILESVTGRPATFEREPVRVPAFRNTLQSALTTIGEAMTNSDTLLRVQDAVWLNPRGRAVDASGSDTASLAMRTAFHTTRQHAGVAADASGRIRQYGNVITQIGGLLRAFRSARPNIRVVARPHAREPFGVEIDDGVGRIATSLRLGTHIADLEEFAADVQAIIDATTQSLPAASENDESTGLAASDDPWGATQLAHLTRQSQLASVSVVAAFQAAVGTRELSEATFARIQPRIEIRGVRLVAVVPSHAWMASEERPGAPSATDLIELADVSALSSPRRRQFAAQVQTRIAVGMAEARRARTIRVTAAYDEAPDPAGSRAWDGSW